MHKRPNARPLRGLRLLGVFVAAGVGFSAGAPAQAAVVPVSPPNGAVFTRGDSVELRVQSAGTYSVDFRVSASPDVGTDGRLVNTELMPALGSATASYPADQFKTYAGAQRVGTVYWQASRRVCTQGPPPLYKDDCSVETAPVQSFSVLPQAAPAPAAPDDEKVYTGRQHNLMVAFTSGVYAPMHVVYSRSSSVGADGVLANIATDDSATYPGYAKDTYTSRVPDSLTGPGTVYWQVYRQSCEDDPDCKVAGAVRSFTILPPHVKLALAGTSPQRLKGVPLSLNAKCSLACQVRVKVIAKVKTKRGPRSQPALGFTRTVKLAGNEHRKVGRTFAGANRRLLHRLVKRYKMVTFTVRATATDEFGRTKTIERRFTVAGPPKPSTGSRGTESRPTERETVESVADAAVREEHGFGTSSHDCRKLDPGYWKCRYSGYRADVGSFGGWVHVRRHTYGWDAVVI